MSRSVEDLIELAGGLESVAKQAMRKHWAVRKWPENGIPEPHWKIFIEAGATTDELHAANERVRCERAESTEAGAEPAHV